MTVNVCISLRTSLRALGGELLVRVGRPEEELPRLVQAYDLGSMHCYEQVAQEDSQVSSHCQRIGTAHDPACAFKPVALNACTSLRT